MTDIGLEDGAGSALVATRGAELRAWRVDGVDLLWSPDPAVWAETAPILFPVVGWSRGGTISVEGRSYPLGVHGFARECSFEVVHRSPSRVRLRAQADPLTRSMYPFDWRLEIEHEVRGHTLTTRMTVCNDGARPMPYACGLHPGFRWPYAGGEAADYAIVFEESEATSVPVISPDGLFTRETRAVPMEGRLLPLSRALLEREALCFLSARSRTLGFVHRPSGATLACAFDEFPHIALWSRPPGRFLCIEAWTGRGDDVDASGDLFARPSMRRLAPGAIGAHAATYSFAAG